ncbi:radical SAM protein [Ruminococcaceae bacterium OttesenSCG-928-D13]|nr:radical SAM protein [Ruminococcaceae bacterium OttesenSCG-928-D13]
MKYSTPKETAYQKNFLEIEVDHYDLRRREFLRAMEIFPPNMRKKITDKTIVLRDLDLCINSICSLNCPHCVFLQPHIKNVRNFDAEMIVEEMDRLLGANVYVTSLAILGGEPLLHPNIVEIIDRVAAMKHIGHAARVVVITNGTVVPDKSFCESIKGLPNGSVIVNDFPLSDKVDEITALFQSNGVKHRVANKDWTNHGSISELHGYSDTELKHLHFVCEAVSMLRDGLFSNCGRSVVAYQEGFIPYDAADFVDIRNFQASSEELNKRLYDHLYRHKWNTSCKYCRGNYEGNEVLPMGG